MTANKRVFGITGPTGSGKSYISHLFSKKGVTIIDCDKIAREIVEPFSQAAQELREYFGDKYFDKDGNLLRREIANVVFSNKEKLSKLNEITHKHIDRKIAKIIDATDGIILIDGAVIIGSPVEKRCEFLVGVLSPVEERIKRLKERDNLTEDEIKNRILSQSDDEFYKENCRFIIENDGKCDLEEKVLEILKIF